MCVELVENIFTTTFYVYGLITLYMFVLLFIGVFLPSKKFRKGEKQYKYAILIPARNEDCVIASLIDSLKKQDYPKELYSVFVVAHNCTDKTAEKARETGAIVYECTTKQKRKGFALKYLLEQIIKDSPNGLDTFDGYIIFDADNVVSKDCLTQANKAFNDKNFDFFSFYQNTKNFGNTLISSYSSIQPYTEQNTLSRPLSVLGLNAPMRGAGTMLRKNLLRQGWRWCSIIEDYESFYDLTSKGYRSTHCEAAKFYDERPLHLKIISRQYMRWSHGHFYVYFKSLPKLLKGVFLPVDFRKKYSRNDVEPKSSRKKILNGIQLRLSNLHWTIANFPMWMLSFVFTFIYPVIALIYFGVSGGGYDLAPMITVLLSYFMTIYVYIISYSAVALIREGRNIRPNTSPGKVMLYLLMWPFVRIALDFVCFASIFWPVKWKPIPHAISKSIEELDAEATMANYYNVPATGGRERI